MPNLNGLRPVESRSETCEARPTPLSERIDEIMRMAFECNEHVVFIKSQLFGPEVREDERMGEISCASDQLNVIKSKMVNILNTVYSIRERL